MDDDEYWDSIANDAALTAALDAAGRAHAANNASSTSKSFATANTTPRPPPPAPVGPSQKSQSAAAKATSQIAAVKQPIPQKVGRGGSSAIIVNSRQKGNPVLAYIKNVPWEFGDIPADYLLSPTTCALFLSLKYHRLHPEYVYTRLKTLGHAYNLRILLVLVDIDNHHDPLRELSKTALLANLTLILSWSSPEAGRYLETYKAYEHTPPTLIQEKSSSDYTTRLVEVLTQVRSVNKVDAVSLVGTFGSVRAAVNAEPEEMLMISGWGQGKVGRFGKAVTEPFKVRKHAPRSSQKARTTQGSGAAVAAKLGIGPAIRGVEGASSSRVEVENWEEDEEALMAAVEAETREKEIRSIATAGTKAQEEGEVAAESETQLGIMQALAKIRERNSGS